MIHTELSVNLDIAMVCRGRIDLHFWTGHHWCSIPVAPGLMQTTGTDLEHHWPRFFIGSWKLGTNCAPDQVIFSKFTDFFCYFSFMWVENHLIIVFPPHTGCFQCRLCDSNLSHKLRFIGVQQFVGKLLFFLGNVNFELSGRCSLIMYFHVALQVSQPVKPFATRVTREGPLLKEHRG